MGLDEEQIGEMGAQSGAQSGSSQSSRLAVPWVLDTDLRRVLLWL